MCGFLFVLAILAVLFGIASKAFEAMLVAIVLAGALGGIAVWGITKLLLLSKTVRKKLGVEFTAFYVAAVSSFLLAYIVTVWLLPPDSKEAFVDLVSLFFILAPEWFLELEWPLLAAFTCGIPGALAGLFGFGFFAREVLNLPLKSCKSQSSRVVSLAILLALVILGTLVGVTVWAQPRFEYQQSVEDFNSHRVWGLSVTAEARGESLYLRIHNPWNFAYKAEIYIYDHESEYHRNSMSTTAYLRSGETVLIFTPPFETIEVARDPLLWAWKLVIGDPSPWRWWYREYRGWAQFEKEAGVAPICELTGVLYNFAQDRDENIWLCDGD